MLLDLRTIFFLIGLISLIMSVAMLAASFSYPQATKSMRFWALGAGLRFVFWVLLVLRDTIPDFFSIVVANTGLVVAELIIFKAIRILQNKRFSNIYLYLSGVLTAAVIVIFTYFYPNLVARIVFISMIGTVVGCAFSYTLIFNKNGGKTFIEKACGLVYIMCALVTAVRLFYILFINSQITSLYSEGEIVNIVFSIFFVCQVMISFVYMLMINSKHTNELKLALAEVRTLSTMLPICSYCRHIRDDKDYWQKIEDYLAAHTGTQFSHGICPACYENEVLPELEAFKAQFQT